MLLNLCYVHFLRHRQSTQIRFYFRLLCFEFCAHSHWLYIISMVIMQSVFRVILAVIVYSPGVVPSRKLDVFKLGARGCMMCNFQLMLKYI